MSIDEAIAHAKEQIDIFGGEHREFLENVADWLEELKEARKGFEENRKAGYKHGYSDGYVKAIDEFAEMIMKYCSMSNMNATMIRQIAEQLKGGAE